MRITLLHIIYFFVHLNSFGQTQKITGRVISEDLETLPGVEILNTDSERLGVTDINGYFELELPQQKSYKLLFQYIGMLDEQVTFSNSCTNIEVILLYASTYDFITINAVERKIKRRRKKLHKVYQTAFEEGIFKNEKPCR